MRPLTRRQFVRASLASAGLLATAPAALRAAEARPSGSFKGTDVVSLGQTGLKVTRLAQGTGYKGYNRSSEHTRRGKEAFDRLARHSLDQGITFFDMADLYGSHPFVKEVIKGLPRDKFTLLSKIWPRKENWVTPSGGAKEEVDRFRKELDTDWLGVCLIHCMQNAKWADEYERIREVDDTLKRISAVMA